MTHRAKLWNGQPTDAYGQLTGTGRIIRLGTIHFAQLEDAPSRFVQLVQIATRNPMLACSIPEVFPHGNANADKEMNAWLPPHIGLPPPNFR